MCRYFVESNVTIRQKSRETVALSSLLGWLTQSVHDQRHKKTPSNNICQPVHISTRGVGRFSYSVHYLVLLNWYWSKATNTDITIGRYPIGQTPFFQDEDFSFFEGSKNGLTIVSFSSTLRKPSKNYKFYLETFRIILNPSSVKKIKFYFLDWTVTTKSEQ